MVAHVGTPAARTTQCSEFVAIVTELFRLLWSRSRNAGDSFAVIVPLRLAIADTLLRSAVLEKRVFALNEIRDWVRLALFRRSGTL